MRQDVCFLNCASVLFSKRLPKLVSSFCISSTFWSGETDNYLIIFLQSNFNCHQSFLKRTMWSALPQLLQSYIAEVIWVVVYFPALKLPKIRSLEEVSRSLEEVSISLEEVLRSLKNSWKILQELSGQGDRHVQKLHLMINRNYFYKCSTLSIPVIMKILIEAA